MPETASADAEPATPEPGSEPASAVVVRIPLPPAIAHVRRRWDSNAAMGVPPHVTILYPFLPSVALTQPVRRSLEAAIHGVTPFDVTFATVDRFPDAIYLVPEPAGPFIELTHAVSARYPDHPPYGGAYEAVVPHLTVADTPGASLDELRRTIRPALPIHHMVSAVEVLVDDGDQRWRRRWRIALGIRP